MDPKRKKVEHHSQVYTYDFTFFGPPELPFPDHRAFIKLIQPLFKKWVFQLETTPSTQRLHYQGRGSLFKKRRHPELCSLLNETDLRGMDVSESSGNSTSVAAFYTLKYDTRTDGPWMDKDWKEPAYIPRQFRDLLDKLYPYQKAILDSRLEFNDRQINFLYDPQGNHGKSTVASLAALHYGALDLPPIGDHKELTQVVCDVLMAKECREPGLVFVDLPRGLTLDPKRFGPFLIAIEQIKKGHVCDVRHHYKEWWFDSPAVWVLANHLPDLSFMSADRWKFWSIVPHYKYMIPHTKTEMIQMSQHPEN